MRPGLMVLGLLAVSGGGWVSGGDWPQFRGPNAQGVAEEGPLPTEWSRQRSIIWQAPLPGRGVSSPVVVGDRLYVTCSSGSRDDQLHLLAFDAHRGRLLWHRRLQATGSTACHPKTCMAAHTPAADQQGVYVLFASGDLAAFDPDGRLLWYRSLVGDYPTITNQVGMAASPVLAGDKLIVPMDNAGESFLAAIDRRYGTNIWKVARPAVINWVTPVLRSTGEGTEILLAGPQGLTAYDAASGQQRWQFRGGGASVPQPLLEGDNIYLPVNGVSKYRLGPRGIDDPPLWQTRSLQTGYPSPLLYRGRIYAVSHQGILACADARNGKELFRERLKGTFYASPVAGDGKVYCLNDTGTCYVIDATTDGYELLAVNELGEETLATPAIAHRRLYIRTDKAVYAIGAR